MEDEFKIVTGEQLDLQHGHWVKPPEKLDPENVPPKLRFLVPIAERYGAADDIYRERLIEKTPPEELKRVCALVLSVENDLDEWLLSVATSDATSRSKEYIAFSALNMFVMSA